MRRLLLSVPVAMAMAGVAASSCDGLTTYEPVVSPPSWECEIDEDCRLGELCSLGECWPGCRTVDDRCPPTEVCIGGQCHPVSDGGPDGGDGGPDPDGGDGGPVECPEDMVPVDDAFCMDRYEASRPNATDSWQGDDNSMATSREHVLPWFPIDKATAQAACAAAGKRLCQPHEFLTACSGYEGTVYPYGDTYQPLVCNGIDTFCQCGPGSPCENVDPCPYPHCFNQPPAGQSEPATGCGSWMQVLPTGSFTQCVSDYGAWDISGNVWELVDDGSAEGHFRGGAYNCIDSEILHRCDYVATNILAKGFRCCK